MHLPLSSAAPDEAFFRKSFRNVNNDSDPGGFFYSLPAGILIHIARIPQLGVRGIIRTTEDADTLLHCLRAVGSGQGWFDQQSQASFFNARVTALTPRETQLVVLVAQGLKNKEIATVLSISEANGSHLPFGTFPQAEYKGSLRTGDLWYAEHAWQQNDDRNYRSR